MRRKADRKIRLPSGESALIVGVVLLLAAPPVAAGGKEEGLARMAGIWQLDTRASDDPRRTLDEARRDAEARNSAKGRTGRRRPEDAPRDREGAMVLDDLRERTKRWLDGGQVLTVDVDGHVVTITDWRDRQRSLQVDGKRVPVEIDGAPAVAEASWRSSDRLVVKTTGGPGGKSVEIYELGNRGQTLFLTVELEIKGWGQPFAFDRVYHRVESGGPSVEPR